MSAVIYVGPERRSQRVYITRHTEYFFQGALCVSVRDRQTGRVLPGHMAVRRPIEKAIRFSADGRVTEARDLPDIGDCLYFSYDGRELITSPIEQISRTERDLALQFSAVLDQSA